MIMVICAGIRNHCDDSCGQDHPQHCAPPWPRNPQHHRIQPRGHGMLPLHYCGLQLQRLQPQRDTPERDHAAQRAAREACPAPEAQPTRVASRDREPDQSV